MTDEVKFILTLLGGAVGAGLLGLFGAWIQSKREHQRWIREERFRAYKEYITLVDQAANMMLPMGVDDETVRQTLAKAAHEYYESLSPSSTVISLLGPEDVRGITYELNTLINRRLNSTARYFGDPKNLIIAREQFIAAARDVLRVR